MFILGVITLVLETVLGFQEMQLFLFPTTGSLFPSFITNFIIATFSRLMVRLHTAPIPFSTVN